MGRRASDLDAVSGVFVDLLARALAKVSLLDRYYAEAGIVREDGTAQPTLALYLSALNAARLTARQLAEHMGSQGETGEQLEDNRCRIAPTRNHWDPGCRKGTPAL
jgi:hypothetical protein